MSDVLVIGGGNIPEDDITCLLGQGVSAVFGPGASIKDVAEYIRGKVEGRTSASQS